MKKERLEKECTELRVDQMARLIEEHFGRMKVNQVDASIFHTKKDAIDKEIERGEHFVESVDFLEFMCDKLTPEVQDQINKLRRESRGDRSRRKERSHRRSRSRSKHKKRRRSRSRSSSEAHQRHRSRDSRRKSRKKKSTRSRSRDRSRSKSLVITVNRSRSRSRRPSRKQDVAPSGPGVTEPSKESSSLEEITRERNFYKHHANQHPEYEERWKVFWKKKQSQLGPERIHTEDIIPEWKDEWNQFLDDDYQKKLSKVNNSSSNQVVNLITLSDDEDDDIEEIRPKPEPAEPVPSTSKVQSESSKVTVRPLDQPGRSGVKTEKARISSVYQVPPEDFSVINLINILSALHSKSLLNNSLATKLQSFKNLALSLEERSHGDSKLLVDEKECFNFVDQCMETLNQKLKTGQVAECQKSTVGLALNMINIFISKSSCQKSDILEIDNFAPVNPEEHNLTKMKIAKAIEHELNSLGKTITQEEFNSLVEAEYIRVKKQINPKASKSSTVTSHKSAPPQPSQAREIFSAYNSQPKPVNDAQDLLQKIDFDAIIKALKIAKQQTQSSSSRVMNHSQPIYNTAPPATSTASSSATSTAQKESNYLSEDELVSLIENRNKMPPEQVTYLHNYMRELEVLDPAKVYRIKKRLKP